MAAATITSKAQVTIPKEVRDHLHVGTGDRIDFVISGPGKVELVKLGKSIMDLAGIFHQPDQQAATINEMHDAIADAVSEQIDRCR